jgi:thioredoxin-dependent peroxiredoxin
MRSVLPCSIGCLIVLLGAGAIQTEDQQSPLAIGDVAPAFNANTHAGDLWQSQDHLGRGRHLIVFFYPAAMTGGCTKQACSYRDGAADLAGLDVEVVGVSADPVNNLKLFAQAQNLSFTLLSDVNACIARRFGVPLKDGGTFKTAIDGKEVVLKRPHTFTRWTFILGPDGKVIYKDTSVDASNDTRKALEFLRTRNSGPQ